MNRLRTIITATLGAAVIGVMVAAAVPAAAAPAHQVAVTAQHTDRRCTRDITVSRDVGETIANFMPKCAFSGQVFADWRGIEVFGAKSTGAASVALQPSQINPLEKDDCDGYALYNSAGTQTVRKVVHGSGC